MKYLMKAWQNYKHIFKFGVAGLAVLILVTSAHEANASVVGDGILSALSTGGEVFLNILSHIVLAIAGFVGTVVVKLLEVILIPVVQYSDFIDHPVVMNGWTIVRDLMNTGFIALMLIIAFGTMFGISRIQWAQQIPRLIIAAIAINFSRLITGLFIDFGQVIMIGFVNAIAQVGAGNFLELLHMQEIQSTESGSGVISGASNFGSALMALAMSCIVLVVIIVILAVLVYRIVVLWVLIIMSPAAFLAGAAKGILSQAEGMYSQWWGKLTAAIMIGPILTFFLWLALSSVNGMTNGFNTNTNPGPDGAVVTNQVATNDNLTGFIIGIALLLAGLEMASSTAGQLGGFAKAAVDKGLGVSKAIAAAPITAATTAGIAVGRKGISSVKSVGAGVAQGTASLYRGATQERRLAARDKKRAIAEDNMSKGGLRGLYGRSQLAKVAEEDRKEKTIQGDLAKKYAGFGSTLGDQEKLDFIKKNSAPGASEQSRAQAMALQSGMVTNETEFASLMDKDPKAGAAMLESVQAHQKNTGDQTGQDKITKMMEKNPQWANADPESMKSALAGMSQEQRAGINKRAWGDANFRKAARDSNAFDFTTADGKKGFSKSFIDAADAHLPPAMGGRATAAAITRDEDETKRHQRDVDSRRGLDMNVQANKDGANSGDAIHNLINANIAGTMGTRVGAGNMKLQDIDLSSIAAGSTTESDINSAIDEALTKGGSAEMIQSLKEAEESGSTQDEKDRATEMLGRIKDRVVHADASPARAAKVNKAARAAQAETASPGRTHHLSTAFSYGGAGAAASNQFAGVGAAKNANEREFATTLGESPTIILDLADEMGDMDGDMARVAAETATPKHLDAMMKQWQQSQGSDMEAVNQKAAEAYGKLLKDYSKKVNDSATGATKAMKKQIKDSLRHYNKRVKPQVHPTTFSTEL